MLERRQKWSFYIIGDGSWVWRVLQPDGTEASAGRKFPTLNQCTVDAALYGYVACSVNEDARANPSNHNYASRRRAPTPASVGETQARR